jgi:hypothetical protein
MERTHLARHDLDWLPPSMKAVRWTVAGTIWAGLGAAAVATITLGKIQPYFWGKGIALLGASGYYAGDRVARAVLRRRLWRLARGAVDLTRLAREQDGELVHARGRVRARQTLPALLDGRPAVYRRVVFVVGGVRLVHEAAVDFSIVDEAREEAIVQVEGARLLAPEPRRTRVDALCARRIARLPLPPRAARDVGDWLSRQGAGMRTGRLDAGEVILSDGDAVEIVGYKTRVVDQTVAARLEREIPMRATLRSGRDLPLLLSPVKT